MHAGANYRVSFNIYRDLEVAGSHLVSYIYCFSIPSFFLTVVLNLYIILCMVYLD